jgi:antitoxin (DNA-binding transcriptional repressor) of toxin-antitoxin stability system
MITITSREFRTNQKSYLDQVAQGAEVLITRGKNEAFKITKVTDDDSLMSKSEFYNMIKQALQEVEEEKTYAMLPNETLDDFMKRMEKENVQN